MCFSLTDFIYFKIIQIGNMFEKRIFYVLMFFSIIGVSCRDRRAESSSEKQNDIITMQVNEPKETLVSEIFDSLSYVVLDDTRDESLIGRVGKLECVDSLFFIKDDKRRLIHKYDDKGNYLSSIGKVGNGPGEYIGLSDFSVDRNKRTLFILDKTGRKILVYDFEGHFLYKMSIEVMANKICVMNGGYALYTSGSDYFTDKKEAFGYNLFFYDEANKLCSKFFPYKPKIDDVIQERNFDYNVDDSILLYHQSVCDTVYLFKSMDVHQKLKIDFGSYSLPFDKITSENFKEYRSRSNYAVITSVLYTQDYLLVNYVFKNRARCFIYDTLRDVGHNMSYLLNDMDETALSMIWPLDVVGNRVYYLKPASDLLEDNKVKQMYINGRKITEESNPILVIGHLK